MTAAKRDFELRQGDQRTLRIAVSSSNLALPVSPSSAIEWWLIANPRPAAGVAPLLRRTRGQGLSLVQEAGAWYLLVELAEADTATRAPGDYYHEARIDDPAGDALTIVTGVINLLPGHIAAGIAAGAPLPGAVASPTVRRAEDAADRAEAAAGVATGGVAAIATARDGALADVTEARDAAAQSAIEAAADRALTAQDRQGTAADRVVTTADRIAAAQSAQIAATAAGVALEPLQVLVGDRPPLASDGVEKQLWLDEARGALFGPKGATGWPLSAHVFASRRTVREADFTTGELPDFMSFSRLSESYRVGPTGEEFVAANVPAFEFLGGVCRGLTLRGSSTNLIRNSALGGAVAGTPGQAPTSWSQVLSGGSLAAIIDDPISAGAKRLRYGKLANSHAVQQDVIAIVASQQTYCFSVRLSAQIALPLQSLVYVASNIPGIVRTYHINGVATASTALVPAGDAIVSVVFSTLDKNGFLFPGLSLVGTPQGSATFWRPQLELGSARGPDIMTTTAAATRAADVATFTPDPGASVARLFYPDGHMAEHPVTPGALFQIPADPARPVLSKLQVW